VPSSFNHIQCLVVKVNEEQSLIGRSTASVADAAIDAKQITCAAFGAAPVVPQGHCEYCMK